MQIRIKNIDRSLSTHATSISQNPNVAKLLSYTITKTNEEFKSGSWKGVLDTPLCNEVCV
jgi:hypothetical protein